MITRARENIPLLPLPTSSLSCYSQPHRHCHYTPTEQTPRRQASPKHPCLTTWLHSILWACCHTSSANTGTVKTTGLLVMIWFCWVDDEQKLQIEQNLNQMLHATRSPTLKSMMNSSRKQVAERYVITSPH
ncbi:hypothetical protein PV04_07865 [Phialophora macrospora]|uniref:Uncharacterized protein n=1 Tax=Phialophora macrospora TaxID=1851006 RepID=A0A0D2FCA5_9EURO|nr:hypothetical protein PV04_07865 [Phialophora macrospora]